MDTIRRIIGRFRSKGRGGGSSNKQDQEATPVQCNVLNRLRKMSRSMENVSLDKELSPSSTCPDGDKTLCNEDRGGSFLTRKILSLSNLSRSSHPEVVQAKIESVLEKYGLVGSNLSLGRSSSLDQPFAWTRSAFGECFHDYLERLGHRGNARDLEALLISPLRVAVNDVKRICETGGKIDVNATVLDTLTMGAAETPYQYSFCLERLALKSETRHCAGCSQCVSAGRVHCMNCHRCSYGLGFARKCEFCHTSAVPPPGDVPQGPDGQAQGPGGQAATASATSSVGNVSELTWSSRGDVLSEAPAASIPTSASVATSRGGWTTMSASSRWWISSEEENNFWACAASSTPGGLTSDVIGSTSVLVRDLWMDRKRSFDNLLLQDCSSFLNVKAANSTNF